MEYILTHKKIAVAEIEIDPETAVISKIGKVFAPEHLPIGVTVTDGIPNRGDLNDWWHGRSIPASRQNIRTALQSLGVANTGKLTEKSFGLSLSDQYWANPSKNPLDWEEINFYVNLFSEDVGNILFGGTILEGNIDLVSPDNTSDGWLKKKWKIIDGKRCLIKAGSDPFQQQPINEAMTAVILKRLHIPHTPYSILWENGLPYSVCENFTNAETELVSAFNIHNVKKIKDASQLYEHYLSCCEELGIPDAQKELDKMLTVDFLIVNYDRHLNNFGAIRNTETLQWLSPAPLFDNGSSLWYNQTNIGGSGRCQPFRETHEEQIKLVRDFSWLNFSDLAGIADEFNDLLKTSPFIDDGRRGKLCRALQDRVSVLMDVVMSREKVYAVGGNVENEDDLER